MTTSTTVEPPASRASAGTACWAFGVKDVFVLCPACHCQVFLKVEYPIERPGDFLRGDRNLFVAHPTIPSEVTCQCGRIAALRLLEFIDGRFGIVIMN